MTSIHSYHIDYLLIDYFYAIRSTHGTIYGYDKGFDTVNTRNEKPLQTVDMIKYNTTTSEDPIIQNVCRSRSWPDSYGHRSR